MRSFLNDLGAALRGVAVEILALVVLTAVAVAVAASILAAR